MATCVEKRHIDNDDSRVFFFCDDTPLFENFRIISAEPIDAFNDERVTGFYFSQLKLRRC